MPAPLHLLPALLRLPYVSFRDRLAIISGMRKLIRWPTADDPRGPTIGDWLPQQGQSAAAIELFWTPIIVSALSETLDRVAVPPVRKVFVDAFLGNRHAYEMTVPSVPLAEFYGGRLEAWLRTHGVVVRQGCPVEQIVGDANGATEIILGSGERVQFDYIVVAAPWRRVAALFSDSLRACLPELSAVSQFQSASITAVHLWFDRSITDLPHAVLPGRTSQWLFSRGVHAFDGSDQQLGHHYQIVISASGNLAERPRNAVIEEVQHELISIWPAAADAKLLQARMITDEHAVFSPLPGVDRLRPPQRTRVTNLFLAGDWTATGWPATMESAVRSGYLAAEGVLVQLGTPMRLVV